MNEISETKVASNHIFWYQIRHPALPERSRQGTSDLDVKIKKIRKEKAMPDSGKYGEQQYGRSGSPHQWNDDLFPGFQTM
jgi:hypothetical protein